MGKNPEKRKKYASYQSAVEESGGGLFPDVELDDPVDPNAIYEIDKYIVHFRMMVLFDDFPGIKVGSHLVRGNYVEKEHGIIDENCLIRIPTQENVGVKSLSSFAKAIVPQDWKRKSGSQRGHTVTPDGWSRITVLQDDGSTIAVENLLFENYGILGYTPEQLNDLPFVYSEMERLGFGDIIADIKDSELKTWRTKRESRSKKASK